MRLIWPALVSRPVDAPMDALLALSSKGQLVIPARLSHLLWLRVGDLCRQGPVEWPI